MPWTWRSTQHSPSRYFGVGGFKEDTRWENQTSLVSYPSPYHRGSTHHRLPFLLPTPSHLHHAACKRRAIAGACDASLRRCLPHIVHQHRKAVRPCHILTLCCARRLPTTILMITTMTPGRGRIRNKKTSCLRRQSPFRKRIWQRQRGPTSCSTPRCTPFSMRILT